jgi:hypothetical protein
MAKISAKVGGKRLHAVAETHPTEWRDISDGQGYHFERHAFILRSDGAILRRQSYKIDYAAQYGRERKAGDLNTQSSTSIAARIKKTIPATEWRDVFDRYARRRGLEVK